jgi:hypothetical protein
MDCSGKYKSLRSTRYGVLNIFRRINIDAGYISVVSISTPICLRSYFVRVSWSCVSCCTSWRFSVKSEQPEHPLAARQCVKAEGRNTLFKISLRSLCTSITYRLLLPLWSIRHPWNALFHFSSLILIQSVGLLGRWISPSQGRYIHEHRINALRHSCLE